MKLTIWRKIIQTAGLILPNSYFKVFLEDGSIYQGKIKGFILPILNCYATPSAYTSCPVGSAQHFMKLRAFPYFILGFLGAIGFAVGRMTCGWICPFGFIQDLLYKIKSPKLKMWKWLRYVKYFMLVEFVIIFPYFFEDTVFCKLCPAGGLTGGLPQVIMNEPLLEIIGTLFMAKLIIVGLTVMYSIAIERFFCRAFCPLGAFLGLFNKASIFSLQVDSHTCVKCGKCQKVCPVDIEPYKTPSSPECIRCLHCVEACPMNSLKFSQGLVQKETKPEVVN